MSGRVLSVLHVLPTFNPRYGGPVAVATGMCRALAVLGVTATLFSMDGKSDPGGLAADRYDKDNRGSWGYCFSAGLLSPIRDLVRASDVVHVHGLWNFPASAAAWCARKEGIPYVLTPHGMLTLWSLTQSRIKKTLYHPVERRNVRGAAALHFLTSEEGEQSARWGSPAKTLILPNGVPPARYDRPGDRERMERLYPVLRGKVVLLFLGRLHPGKGLDILIPAFSRLRETRPECALVVCGPDAEFGVEVEQMVRTLGLSGAVLRTGFVVGEAKHALLGGADVFVLPSRHEGDSVAIKEAMQAGLPLIITSQCGFPDAAKDGVGIVVEPRIDELTQGMERLVADLNLRREMGVRGRNLVESVYVWDMIIPRLLEVYENLVDHSHRTGPRRTDSFSCKPGRGQ